MNAGKALYMKGIPGTEIAGILDVSATTVSNWVTKGGWRDERVRVATQQRSMQERLNKLIDYQLEVMDSFVDDRRSEGKLVSIDKGQIYTLRQMFISLNFEPDFATTVNIVRQFVEHINRQSPDLAKALIPFTNDFIADRKEVLAA